MWPGDCFLGAGGSSPGCWCDLSRPRRVRSLTARQHEVAAQRVSKWRNKLRFRATAEGGGVRFWCHWEETAASPKMAILCFLKDYILVEQTQINSLQTDLPLCFFPGSSEDGWGFLKLNDSLGTARPLCIVWFLLRSGHCSMLIVLWSLPGHLSFPPWPFWSCYNLCCPIVMQIAAVASKAKCTTNWKCPM